VFKTFIFGIVLGVVASFGLLYFVPVVDQHRETSLVSVEPNGRNLESFFVNLPDDRILARNAGENAAVPAGMQWPSADVVADARVELFKIRDRNDSVIGVASRMSGPVGTQGSVVEWTVHLPARGTMYVAMREAPGADGLREGLLRAGTGEFAARRGSLTERFVAAIGSAGDGVGAEGRIELQTILAGIASSVE
jgi:hypothetical protein